MFIPLKMVLIGIDPYPYTTIVHDWLMTDSWLLYLDSLHLGWCMATHQRTHHVDEPPRPASSSTTRQRHLFECVIIIFPHHFVVCFPKKSKKMHLLMGGNRWSGEARPQLFWGYYRIPERLNSNKAPFPSVSKVTPGFPTDLLQTSDWGVTTVSIWRHLLFEDLLRNQVLLSKPGKLKHRAEWEPKSKSTDEKRKRNDWAIKKDANDFFSVIRGLPKPDHWQSPWQSVPGSFLKMLHDVLSSVLEKFGWWAREV